MDLRLKTVSIYSCLAESPEETPHVLMEAFLTDGRVISGELSPADAAALAESLQRAARTVTVNQAPLRRKQRYGPLA